MKHTIKIIVPLTLYRRWDGVQVLPATAEISRGLQTLCSGINCKGEPIADHPGYCTVFVGNGQTTYVITDWHEPSRYAWSGYTVAHRYTNIAATIATRMGVDGIYCEIDGIGTMVPPA